MQHKFLVKVAFSLNIELDIQNMNEEIDPTFPANYLKQTLENNHIDFVLSPLFFGNENLLKFTSSKNIPIFTYNTSLDARHNSLLGKPRENYPNWLGHISPDDEGAGYMLAEALLTKTKNFNRLLAIAGKHQSVVSGNRERGLVNYFNSKGEALMPIVHSDWTFKRGYQVTKSMLKRDPNIEYIWVVSTSVAFGVIKAVEEMDKSDTIKVGAFDWLPETMGLIENKTLFMSYGGHFVEAGKALIYMRDYIMGHDFKETSGVILKTKLNRLTLKNLNKYKNGILGTNWDKIDYKQFSYCLNQGKGRYELSIDNLIGTN
ncbi:substrate-binding domain-containing protein [Catenovulum maritimum]|nr:substrate-binding domain-containing protein [Catenovulum maritimum]